MITHDEFKKLWECEFKTDDRFIKLYERLGQYYKDTYYLDNKESLIHYKSFREWCHENGYSQDDINNIKRAYKW